MADPLKLMLNAGIGDMVISKYILAKINSPIFLSASKAKAEKYRNASYYNFAVSLLQLIFSSTPHLDSKFIITNDQTYPNLHWTELVRSLHVEPDIAKINLDDGTDPISDRYIVLFTKVREYPSSAKNTILALLREILKIDIKVVLVGEKNLIPNLEYLNPIIQPEVFCFYDIIPQSNKIIDLTSNNIFSLDKFRHDCSIIKHAIATINIGAGGNLFISTSLCDHTISLIKPPEAVANRFDYQVMGRAFARAPSHKWVHTPDRLLAELYKIL